MIWNRLDKFTELVKFKSLSEVARNGNTSQPKWSRIIDNLKQTFELELVQRNHNGIKLTEKGQNLLKLIAMFKANLKNFKSNN